MFSAVRARCQMTRNWAWMLRAQIADRLGPFDRVSEIVQRGSVGLEHGKQRMPAQASIAALNVGHELRANANSLGRFDLSQSCRSAQAAKRLSKPDVLGGIGRFRTWHLFGLPLAALVRYRPTRIWKGQRPSRWV